MAKRKAMSESELASLLDTQIADAISYENSELASHREKALAYYEGEMTDLEAEEGKSAVVSHDVADTLGWIMPGLMRVFLQGDKVAEYQPVSVEDEQWAKDATEGVNFLFLERCDGYSQLRAACFDGLLHGNGMLKHWWDDSVCYKVETLRGISEDLYIETVNDPNVEVLAHTARDAPADVYSGEQPAGDQAAAPLEPSPAGVPAAPGHLGIGPLAAPKVHDLKIKRKESGGKLRVKSFPSEDFLLCRDAVVLDETVAGCGHKRIATRSELIKEGFDPEIVNELPEYVEAVDEAGAKHKRDTLRALQGGGSSNTDKSMQKVRIYEWFPLVDYDGDGVAERRKVVIGDLAGRGEGKERKILENEEWTDDLPFTDIVPDPVPHRWRGRSVFDETQDVQRIKTVLTRQMLDNLYLQNNPQREAITGQIDNPEELITPSLGGVVWSKTGTAVRDLVVPFVAANAFQMVEYMDGVIEKRTGVSRASAALEPETLSNQSATAASLQDTNSKAKVELYARNIAETGLKRLFKCILKLVVKYQKEPFWIRRLGRPVQVDPRHWNVDMDVSVDVGLGAGTKERTMAFLNAIAAKQEQFLMSFGPVNPLCGFEELRATYADMIEVADLKTADKYFKPIDPQMLEQWIAEQSQKPDPEMAKAQAQMQLEQFKAETAGQLEQMKTHAKAQIEAAQAQADMAVRDRESQAQIMLERVKLENQKDIELFKAQVQAQIEQMKMAHADKTAERDHHFRRREHDAKIAADGLKAREKGDGGDEILSAADVQAEQIREMFGSVAKALEQLSKPKKTRIIRGPDGRALGAETLN